MKKSRILCLVLALLMVVSIAACGEGGGDDTTGPNTSGSGTSNPPASTPTTSEPGTTPEPYTGPDWDAINAMDYEDACDALYEYNLGEFAKLQQAAQAVTSDTNLRTALFAQAEAKLLESGVFVPFVSNVSAGYGMTRQVPRSMSTAMWGWDADRYHTVICTNELIKSEDRLALTELWSNAADEAAYFAAAKTFLAEHGYTINDTYNTYFSSTPVTWDVNATSSNEDQMYALQGLDFLLYYDAKNTLQYGLATSYDVSDDGTVYTFHIREGVKWVDQQGREVGEVQADDWVAAAQHTADFNDMLGYLYTETDGCGIKNYDAFINGDITDFSEVGVKAIDKYTLQYTLEKEFPAFPTMLVYGCFAPMCRSYYESQGGKFGAELDASADSYKYGQGPDTIAYCGPYLVTNYVEENVVTLKANPAYWNAEHVQTPTINFSYNDSSDIMRSYNECVAGTVVSCGLNANTLVRAKADVDPVTGKTYFEAYCRPSATDGSIACCWLNINRGSFANYNDATKGVSPKTEEQIERTRIAMNNQNFRLAFAMSIDRGAVNALSAGEELKLAIVRNSYSPGNFIQLTEDTTIDINGTSTTFKAGTYNGEITQAQLDADGVPIQVWDPNGNDGLGSSDGFDGWYNVDNAKAYLQKAIDELAQVGVEISAENPIYIDYPMGTYSETLTNRANVYKQSVESALEGKIILNLVPFDSNTDRYYGTFACNHGNEYNYDFSDNSAWGPDYGDIGTYINTMGYGGYMTKCVGLW